MIDRYKRFKSKEEVKYMKHFGEFLREQRGVSPVIGVILMVAVTVVMGAVIAGFVYGYVGTTIKAPNVALSVIDDPATTGNTTAYLLIKHNGGETIPANAWQCSVTLGKESTSKFEYETETGAKEISTGTVLPVTKQTITAETATVAGWYHVVAVHVGSDTILIDTNVLVR